MFFRELKLLFNILDESPFFTELSVQERETLIKELIRIYPQLLNHSHDDTH
jgi:hypothetical protein